MSDTRQRYDAPRSRAQALIGVVLAAVAVALVVVGALEGLAAVGAAVVLAAALTVRGYAVEPGALSVRRLGWETRLDLDGLVSAEADPGAMRWAWQVVGISSPFAFVGWFWSRRTGGFSAYATDRARSVVLRWPGRTVVVTPDDPAGFVAAVEAAAR